MSKKFEKINCTVGPVQMEEVTRELGSQKIPYFRTAEFSELMKQNERLMCCFFDAPEKSHCIFMTGSGTASMEACVMNLFSEKDRVLVVNGGSFGQRLVDLCRIHAIPFVELKLAFGEPVTSAHLKAYENAGITAMFLQLCETSTGILYDMDMVGSFCMEHGIFLAVDAISGFLADSFSMKRMHVNAAITGSQKALALPPGLSFIVLDEIAQKRCEANDVKSLYFNLADYLKNGERGQTPFTPAVGTLIQLNEKLCRMEKEGGIQTEHERIQKRASFFRSRIADLPLKIFTPERASSNCVTALSPISAGVSAYTIFERLKDEYNIWLCPNGGELKDTVVRVGHIGCISDSEMEEVILALHDMHKRGLL